MAKASVRRMGGRLQDFVNEKGHVLLPQMGLVNRIYNRLRNELKMKVNIDRGGKRAVRRCDYTLIWRDLKS